MSHTPEPWTRDGAYPSAISANKKHIAMVSFYKCADENMRIDEAEHEANANLIVAAPDLLAALEAAERKLMDWFMNTPPNEGPSEALMAKVEVAIARAKGEA